MSPPKDVDAYLTGLPKEQRDALEKLRKIIQAAAPKAEEVISYQIPYFKYHGPLVAFRAARNHCSFHVMSFAVMDAHKAELKGYDTAPATIHFPSDKPLPAALVKKLVRARIAENEKKAKK